MDKELAFYMHIGGFEGFDKSVDFDKKQIRKAMRQAGRIVQGGAKKRVGKTGGSTAGDYPARRRGLLQRSIKTKVSRSGFLVRVAPFMVAGMKAYYPAFLFYGAKRKPGARRDRRSKGTGAMRIEARGNYMADELKDDSGSIQRLLEAAFSSALVIK
ncbi:MULTISPECIES: hypothetical protein [unclassified Herbaspirillum]|uniref:hypothetical protein n=1 Tax=unclassified Herbaspirillum TaxID=2624150 RepID=UPI000E2E75DE|nr:MULTISPECIES: hypothetical protein [unclassified Herbaspirillum]RFB73825.1 hypothetical protein DZB54_06005 [Herbaspirillum sp. 3R-3a1]TFI10364.1 hypothetical protein E4P32_02165 [Herbaspirillum sp. 3R11]TFI16268.1 hypothetical protein E4P31_02170 [Herbaspirillum sp. 3R-11]TFI28365.1 hypothetical protein E4P30_08235 [Herbaspirillum sp. 3C11]